MGGCLFSFRLCHLSILEISLTVQILKEINKTKTKILFSFIQSDLFYRNISNDLILH